MAGLTVRFLAKFASLVKPSLTQPRSKAYNVFRRTLPMNALSISERRLILTRPITFFARNGRDSKMSPMMKHFSSANPNELTDVNLYHHVADSLLERIEESIDRLAEDGHDVEVSYAQGVLEIELMDKGTWVINKQTPNLQIWWSSPISGPKRFEFAMGKQEWTCSRDPSLELFSLLKNEISAVCGDEIGSKIFE
mmetsp:Transcript_11946/g.19186  ORF Transcript_11946/g.19186 Transcript_11946/m.19186 type:complete len:195 (+) Transcript_11946:233-817(+)